MKQLLIESNDMLSEVRVYKNPTHITTSKFYSMQNTPRSFYRGILTFHPETHEPLNLYTIDGKKETHYAINQTLNRRVKRDPQFDSGHYITVNMVSHQGNVMFGTNQFARINGARAEDPHQLFHTILSKHKDKLISMVNKTTGSTTAPSFATRIVSPPDRPYADGKPTHISTRRIQ